MKITYDITYVVLKMLQSQQFYNWYVSGPYDAAICGVSNAPTDEEITEQLKKMLEKYT